MNVTFSPADAEPRPISMSFSGRAGEFLAMLVKGSLLLIPTFGFYRFWLLTRIRRHLWSNTRVGGEAFEYTGTPKELLIGFLIAAAILVPVYIGYFVLTIMAEEAQALASIPLVAILYVLTHFVSYRARRYRASRTTFRGLRFWMTGAGWAYTLRAILWDLAMILSLGLAMPWAAASLERYRMRNTYFGTIQGGFTSTGWVLFKRGALLWLGGLCSIALCGGIFWYVREHNPDRANFVGALLVGVMILLVLPLSWAAGAIITRWHLTGLRFGDATASSDLGIGAFFGPVLRMLLSLLGFTIAFAIVLLLGVFVFQGVVAATQAALQAGSITGGVIATFAAGALGYIAWFLGMGIIQRYFLERGLWVVIAKSVTISNLAALDGAKAAGDPSGFIGEGFADALDFEIGI